MKRWVLCLGGTWLIAATAQGHPLDAQTLGPRYLQGSGPGVVARMPDAVPESRVLPVGLYNPKRSWTQPVGRLDGAPVCPPLFPSVVSDPVDRALILRDHRRSHFALPGYELGPAFQRYQQAQFHGILALRDARLQKEHATLEDYRNYVADELRINVMLYQHCWGAVSPAEYLTLRREYLATLRRKAAVEMFPS